ncbi:anaerobic dehydrogenase, typically selenocysteine-containing [Actinobacteria bacterium IMCC26207]|nr:anaerobic dehydrogenase, typically selenocysteine-containing [Actinobacteria bacterium IMCC26207]
MTQQSTSPAVTTPSPASGSPDPSSPDPTLETHIRTCPLCEATCGLEITLKDGEITRIRGDREDVFSKGFICPKGSTLKQLHADPDRVRTPLIKRNGEFVPATWDEAFEAVAEGFGKIWEAGDRNAIAVYLGNPTAHSMAGAMFAPPLIKAIKTNNLFSASTVDQMPKHVSSGFLFGGPNAIPVPDLDRTDYLLMLGANPLESNGSICTAPDFPGRLEAIRSRGGKVLTVDPRRTKTADASDEYMPIRPGTDALWLAALVTEINTAGLVDPGRLSPMLDGLNETLQILSPFTADSVAAHTRIRPEDTRRIARELGEAPTAAVYGRIGTHTTEYGTLASWLVEVLNIVTGNLDSAGGAMFPEPAYGAPTKGRTPSGRGFLTGRWTSRVSEHPEVRGEFPVAALAEEIDTPGPGQVRGLLTSGGNPVRSCPNSERLDAAFAQLEFMVSIDIYINETTRHADVILPSPSALAKPHFDFAFYGLSVRNIANYSPPLHDADDATEPGMDEHEIFARLTLIASGLGAQADPEMMYSMMLQTVAERGGLNAEEEQTAATAANYTGVEAILDLMLRTGPYEDLNLAALLAAPHGIDLGPLKPRLPEMLRTASGHIEMANPSITADVPRLVLLLDSVPDDRLLLVGRRHLRSNNSWMHNISVLVKGKQRCTLQLNPVDASELGILDGQDASLQSETGQVVALVEITDEVAIGTVSLPHGWGHDAPGTVGSVAAATPGVNSNLLTGDQFIDPLSGNARLNAIPVTVAAI